MMLVDGYSPHGTILHLGPINGYNVVGNIGLFLVAAHKLYIGLAGLSRRQNEAIGGLAQVGAHRACPRREVFRVVRRLHQWMVGANG